MNWRFAIPFVLGLLLAPNLQPQHPEDFQTGGLWNGRHWTAMNFNEKMYFLEGYIDSVKTVAAITKAEGKPQQIGNYWPSKFSLMEVLNAVDDEFNGAPLNARLPIAMVISRLITLKAAGADESTVQKKLAELRAEAALQ